MQNNGIEMNVHVNGRSVKEYTHQGMSFIEARDGTNYTIKLKNNTGNRAMVVVSVDGLDVVSGKNAAETDTGYIIDAYSNVEIKGYRISDNDSAAFVFTSKGKSYVQNVKGDARNCGVIGVRAYAEKTNYTYINPAVSYYIQNASWTTDSSHVIGGTITSGMNNSITYGCNVNATNVSVQPLGKARAASVSTGVLRSLSASNFDTGTGWGQKQEDKVNRVSFERGILLGELTMYYASKDALIEMGVDVQSKKQVGMPQAFGDYCKPPKGWIG